VWTPAFAALARSDYVGFLRDASECHAAAPLSVKTTRQYRRYLASLAQALCAFVARAQPLVDLRSELLDPAAAEFRALLQRQATLLQGQGEGEKADNAVFDWPLAVILPFLGSSEGRVETSAASSGAVAVEEVSGFASASDLLTQRDAEWVKQQLRARGLKCGGTPRERAERLFSVRALAPVDYPKKLRDPAAAAAAAPAAAAAAAAADDANGTSHSSSGGIRSIDTQQQQRPEWELLAAVVPGLVDPVSFVQDAVVAPLPGYLTPVLAAGSSVSPAAVAAFSASAAASQHLHTVALESVVVFPLLDALAHVINSSRRRAEGRLTRTHEELTAERQAEVAEAQGLGTSGSGGAAEDKDDEDEKPIYNPLNLPLREDGRPMPFWLWKLHGLNKRYPCEICGGAEYEGRRNFDRHFQDARHAHGMKVLGIPNTKHFHDITRIEDAQRLHAKLTGELTDGRFVAAAGEEFEDSMGNVVDRRTYELLARQGLL
jgi:splicing factor 3A subunit 3